MTKKVIFSSVPYFAHNYFCCLCFVLEHLVTLYFKVFLLQCHYTVTVQKLEIQLRVKIDSLYLTTPKHSGGEDKLAVQVQTPKHSGGADNLGSAESPARAENTVQSAPFREY